MARSADRPARASKLSTCNAEGYPTRKSGWAELSPATICSVGSVTGKRTFTNSGLANVLDSAAVACVKCAAATQASSTGRPASAGSDHLARNVWRNVLSQKVAQPFQSYTNTPRSPVEPPDVIAV